MPLYMEYLDRKSLSKLWRFLVKHIYHTNPTPYVCILAQKRKEKKERKREKKRKKKNSNRKRHEIIETGWNKIDLNRKETGQGINTCSLSTRKKDVTQNYCAHRASPQRRQVGLSK